MCHATGRPRPCSFFVLFFAVPACCPAAVPRLASLAAAAHKCPQSSTTLQQHHTAAATTGAHMLPGDAVHFGARHLAPGAATVAPPPGMRRGVPPPRIRRRGPHQRDPLVSQPSQASATRSPARLPICRAPAYPNSHHAHVTKLGTTTLNT
jgi:hypothetical protein